MGVYPSENFTDDEAAVLRPYFTNLDRPVFALVNLPEVVKGALFARYSRTAQESAPTVPRRVRRTTSTSPATSPSTRPSGCGGPRSSTTACSSSTATTPSRSSAACTSRASSRRTCSPRSSSGVASWRTSSSRRATSSTTRSSTAASATTATAAVLASREHAWRYIADMDAQFTTYAELLPALHRLGARALPEGAGRLRLRLQADDQGEGVRRGPRHPARGHAVERRHLRHRSGLRGAAAAHARAPVARGARVRGDDAGRAPQGDPELPHPGRPRGPRGRLERLPGRDPPLHPGAGRAHLRR